MRKINRTQAEQRFATIEKRQSAILSEHEVANVELRKKTAKLKALRLLKEAQEIREK